MKQLFTLTIIICLLSACTNKKNAKELEGQSSKTELDSEIDLKPKEESQIAEIDIEKDTIYNYWELILDTTKVEREFDISEKKYSLEIKTFSLNDSAIVRTLGRAYRGVYIDHSHTMVSDFNLSTDSLISMKRIDRTFFKDSLFNDFYKDCNLFSTEIDSIKENVIFLKSDLAIPDSDNQWRVWYTLKIANDKIDSLVIKYTDYVGL